MLQVQINNQLFTVSGLLSFSPAPPPLNAPTDLTFDPDASGENNVVMSWGNHAVGATSNEIWRNNNGAGYLLLATIPATDSTYTDVSGVAPGVYAEYKVRAVNGVSQSDFCEPRGVANDLGSLSLVTYSYPYLVLHFNTLLIGNDDAATVDLPLLQQILPGGLSIAAIGLTTLNLPVLNRISTSLAIGQTQLTTISLPLLATVVTGDLSFDGNPVVTSISCPALGAVDGTLSGEFCPALSQISFPSLATVGSNLDFGGNAQLNQVNLNALTSVGTVLLSGCSSLTNLQLGALVTVTGDLGMDGLVNLSPLNLPNLQSVGSGVHLENCAMQTADFSSLQTVSGDFIADNLGGLASLSFPALTSLGGSLSLFNSPALASVSFPLVVFTNTTSIDISFCVLDAASVNMVLARGVASATDSSSYILNGGTNAAPTGQGIADKATLEGQGNTVSTN